MDCIKFFVVNFITVALFLVFTGGAIVVNNSNSKNKQNLINKDPDIKTLTAGVLNPPIDSFIFLEKNKKNECPASELYEEKWNTNFLKVYSGIVVPDSFVIDVSSFVVPISGKITSHYGFRKTHFHYGIDIKLNEGDTIRAAFEGKVRVKKYDHKGYGYYLVLRHPNGLETVYGHLSEFLVDQDKFVMSGQPIALGGTTGRSFGSHLHFEFRFLGNAINPSEIIDLDKFSLKENRYVYIKDKSEKICNTCKNKPNVEIFSLKGSKFQCN